ncbi:putative Aldo/keto reductase [Seiridium cardinale]|uniref:Aldo/keto reductase n=1 Tax=Seiridium cardinale TaxID=138064 RepID=A0ABR2Y7P8_9PEZI
MAVSRLLSAVCAIALAASPSLAAEIPTNGVKEIPQLGLGTWLADKDKVAHAVDYALNSGYDHIDAAWIYRNEDQTGNGIAASGISRKDIWVTSKLWNSHHRASEAPKAIAKSIADLGVGYLDLYLVHWPVAFVPDEGTKLDEETSLVDTWRALEDLVRANLTRYIGISNYAKKDVQTILDICEICPYAHEFETHPYLQQQDFVDWHDEVGLKVIAYSPLGNTNPTYHKDLPPLLENGFWKELAQKKNATVAQTVLAWGFQRGTIIIPKASNEKHLDENRDALKIRFSDEEMKEINKQDKHARLNNPGKNWGVNLFADLDDPSQSAGENAIGEL